MITVKFDTEPDRFARQLCWDLRVIGEENYDRSSLLHLKDITELTDWLIWGIAQSATGNEDRTEETIVKMKQEARKSLKYLKKQIEDYLEGEDD